jgi:hypothetical protein
VRREQGLQRLRRVFPLQQRIGALAPPARAAYIAILSQWVRGGRGRAPKAPATVLQTLAAMDAIVIGHDGIGCYPFSARNTGIAVLLNGRQVYAMCAIDALAIPALMRQAGQIATTCAVCGRPLTLGTDSEGNATEMTTQAEVVWHDRQTHLACCGESLCPNIRFVCRSCATAPDAMRFTVVDAAAIGGAFFAFQRELLTAS